MAPQAPTIGAPPEHEHEADPDRPPSSVHFPFAFDPAFRLAALPFGIVPSRTGVDVDDERLTARFGSWVVSTPLANVLAAEVTGPYHLTKVIGGPHLSFSDRGLTFATNARQGACIRFVRPVRGIDPLGRVVHPGLTVTVADPAPLVELLDVASRHHGSHGDVESVAIDHLEREVADELLGLSAAELRDRAKALGIRGVAKLRKAELADLLTATRSGTR